MQRHSSRSYQQKSVKKRRAQGHSFPATLKRSFRYFLALLVLIGANVYVFYLHAKFSVPALKQAALEQIQSQGGGKTLANAPLPVSTVEVVKNEPHSVKEVPCLAHQPLQQSLLAANVPATDSVAIAQSFNPIVTDMPERSSRLFLYYEGQRLVTVDYHYSKFVGGRLERQPSGKFLLSRKLGAIQKTNVTISGIIDEKGLAASLKKQGEERLLALQLEDLLRAAGDSLIKGDSYSVLCEKVFLKKQFWRYGKVLAFSYQHQGVPRALYYYTADAKSAGQYYYADGKSVRRLWMTSPVEYLSSTSTRLGSLVFSAKSKNPVYALASGIISIERDQKNRRYIMLLASQLRVQYGDFNLSVRDGQSVKQGQIIGTVTDGSLSLLVRHKNAVINPLTATRPAAIQLTAAQKVTFNQQVAQYRAAVTKKSGLPAFGSWLSAR